MTTSATVAGTTTGRRRNLLHNALLWLRSRPTMSPGLVRTVIALDLVWVFGSVAALLLRDSLGLTVGGAWSVAIGADIVALFALLQYVGPRRSLRESVRTENA